MYINYLFIWNKEYCRVVLVIVFIAKSVDLKEPAVVGLKVSKIGRDD